MKDFSPQVLQPKKVGKRRKKKMLKTKEKKQKKGEND